LHWAETIIAQIDDAAVPKNQYSGAATTISFAQDNNFKSR